MRPITGGKFQIPARLCSILLLSSILVLIPFSDFAHVKIEHSKVNRHREPLYVPPPDPGRASWGPQPPVAPWTLQKLPETSYALPIIFPLIGPYFFKRSYNLNYGGYRHTGVDIDAPMMTPIVAPFSGVIGLKSDSYWIYGDNGWITLGTHLNDDNLGTDDHRGNRDLMFAPYLKAGDYVHAGELIGYVGDSGDATGPHLHFELYKPGHSSTESRIRDPFSSLYYAQHLSSPRAEFHGQSRLDISAVRLFGCIRDWNPRSRILTLLLTGKQYPRHSVIATSYPHWVKVEFRESDLGARYYDPASGISQHQIVYSDCSFAGKSDYYKAEGKLAVAEVN